MGRGCLDLANLFAVSNSSKAGLRRLRQATVRCMRAVPTPRRLKAMMSYCVGKLSEATSCMQRAANSCS